MVTSRYCLITVPPPPVEPVSVEERISLRARLLVCFITGVAPPEISKDTYIYDGLPYLYLDAWEWWSEAVKVKGAWYGTQTGVDEYFAVSSLPLDVCKILNQKLNGQDTSPDYISSSTGGAGYKGIRLVMPANTFTTSTSSGLAYEDFPYEAGCIDYSGPMTPYTFFYYMIAGRRK